MASVMAIVSKAVFDKMAPKDVDVGDLIETDRYVSKNPAFDELGDGDAIFLVTVRPGDTLWLVAIVEGPEPKKGTYIGAMNETPIKDVTAAIPSFVFASGKGLVAKKGALGMSLQTPRVLTDEDVELLRDGGTKKKGGKAGKAYANAVEATPKMQKAAKSAARAAKATKQGTGLRFENYRLPLENVDDISASEKKQILALVKQEGLKKLDDVVDNEEWTPFELVDIADVATGKVKYQLYLWPYGSGAAFEHSTTKNPWNICQHGPDGLSDEALRSQLEAAWHTGKKQLKIQEMVDWSADDDQ